MSTITGFLLDFIVFRLFGSDYDLFGCVDGFFLFEFLLFSFGFFDLLHFEVLFQVDDVVDAFDCHGDPIGDSD